MSFVEIHVSIIISLPYQRISVQILIAEDIQTICALRIGLSVDGSESEHYRLLPLNFHQSFFKMGQTLAQNLPIILDLSKIVNETYPMSGKEVDYKRIYIPTVTVDPDSIFLSPSQYIRSTSTPMKFQIKTHETAFYVKNIQRPIIEFLEVVFHNLLFTIVFF